MCLYEDNKENIYIGTDGGGINIINTKNKQITIFTTSNGLAGNVIFQIFKDSTNNLWVATGTGLSLKDGNAFINFTVESGLITDSIFQIIEDANARFWLSSSKGLLPQVLLTFKVMQKSLSKDTH